MTRLAERAGWTILLLGAACGPPDPPVRTEPPAGYPLAYAMQDCAPWDGIATTIILSVQPLDPAATMGSEVAGPHLWISIYESPTELTGRRFEVDQSQVAGAMRCEGEGPCEPAAGGWVRIRETSASSDLVGDFELEFEGAESIAGGFEAEWHQRPVMCG